MKVYVPIRTSVFNYIPDDTPNKEFYRDLVCKCERYGNDHWANRIGFHESLELERAGTPHLNKMQCGGYEAQNYLRICAGCDSVFYTAFTHSLQHEIEEYSVTSDGRFCWHCLEAGMNRKKSWRYMDLPKSPPIKELLNPYVKPTPVGEKLDALLDSIEFKIPDEKNWWE